MADLQRRGPRHVRERRAYQLALTGGTAGVVAVVSLVLAVAGVLSGAIPVIAIIVAVLCYLLFRRTTS